MSPIRVGFIGLSASGRWAANAHLPYLRNANEYTITALCNSTVSSAEAARSHYSFPESTKCYGSPSDLASDPNVDLVVCSVRVDKHYETLKPSLEAGKAIFCEWPLGANAAEGRELTALARENGCRTMVGLQARKSPVVLTVKRLVEGGHIGRVLSSSVTSSAGNFGATENATLKYVNEKAVGGNMLSIHFGHMFDYVLFALGELESVTALLSTQRPEVGILDADGKVIEIMKRETPDQIIVHGVLKSGGVLSVHQRGGGPFKGEPGLTWRIYGEKGEILVTAAGSFLQIGYPDMTIRVHDHATGETEIVDWQNQAQGEQGFVGLPFPARNVARMYEAWANGKDELFSMEDATRRLELLEQLVNSSKSGNRVILS